MTKPFWKYTFQQCYYFYGIALFPVVFIVLIANVSFFPTALFSVLIALCATFHLTHSAKSSFCKGRHPKLCHVHIGKRTFFSDDRDLSVPANIDPMSPAARLLAVDPSTIDLSGYLPEENAQLRQSPAEYLANQGMLQMIMLIYLSPF